MLINLKLNAKFRYFKISLIYDVINKIYKLVSYYYNIILT